MPINLPPVVRKKRLDTLLILWENSPSFRSWIWHWQVNGSNFLIFPRHRRINDSSLRANRRSPIGKSSPAEESIVGCLFISVVSERARCGPIHSLVIIRGASCGHPSGFGLEWLRFNITGRETMFISMELRLSGWRPGLMRFLGMPLVVG
jgi:hypothetical protein